MKKLILLACNTSEISQRFHTEITTKWAGWNPNHILNRFQVTQLMVDKSKSVLEMEGMAGSSGWLDNNCWPITLWLALKNLVIGNWPMELFLLNWLLTKAFKFNFGLFVVSILWICLHVPRKCFFFSIFFYKIDIACICLFSSIKSSSRKGILFQQVENTCSSEHHRDQHLQ